MTLVRARLALVLVLACALPALAQPAPATGDMSLPEMLTALSKDPRAPGVVDALLAEMGKNPAAAAMLSAEQKQKLKAVIDEAIRTGKVDGLEAPLVLTVSEMGAAATVAHGAHVVNPGRTASTTPTTGQSGQSGGLPGAPARVVKEPLGIPVAVSQTPPAPAANVAAPGALGALGVEHGRTWPNPNLDGHRADSERLASVLNRLAMNPAGHPTYVVTVGEREACTPDALIALLQATGHTVQVEDVRTFANFADLSYQGRSVAAAVWTDTGLPVPGKDRTLAVPVTHSQHELHVRGPVVTADVSFFMGIDGEAKFRGMHDARPDWTGRRVAHTYSGAKAVEATRVAGEVRRAMTDKAQANPDLPWGGYYALGVCNDSNAFVEYALNGKTSLYPLTRDLKYYQGQGEIDRISRAMPVDGRGAPADLDRVLASMPEENPDELFFPSLRDDIRALQAANASAQRGQTGQTAPATGQTAPARGMTDELDEHTGQQQAPSHQQPAPAGAQHGG